MMAVCDKVAAAAARSAGADELTRVVAQASGRTVLLLDPDFQVQAKAGPGNGGCTGGWDPKEAGTASLLHELAAGHQPLRAVLSPGGAPAWDCLAAPLIAGGTVLGYLLMAAEQGGAGDDADLIVANSLWAAGQADLIWGHCSAAGNWGRHWRVPLVRGRLRTIQRRPSSSFRNSRPVVTVSCWRRAGCLALLAAALAVRVDRLPP
jgi:hypothetical protein